MEAHLENGIGPSTSADELRLDSASGTGRSLLSVLTIAGVAPGRKCESSKRAWADISTRRLFELER